MQYSIQYLIDNSPYHKELAEHFERSWSKMNDTICHNVELETTNKALNDSLEALSKENSVLVARLENVSIFGLLTNKFKSIKFPKIRIEW